jgi:hypothetical protein
VTMVPPEAHVVPEPAIELRQTAAEPGDAHGKWNIIFLVENQGKEALELLTARLPHGQFRSEEQRFDPPLSLAPGENILFSSRVRCHEPPGLVTENAFVLFLAVWRHTSWRIFARIRVTIDDAEKPQTAVESITTQRVGFSGIDN